MTTSSDWDPVSSESLSDPRTMDRTMRETCPVAYSDTWGGFWSLFSYDDIATVARDSDTFRAADRIIVPEPGRGPWLPLQSDPPDHQRYRDVIAPLFRASRLKSFEPQLRRMTNKLIDDFIDDHDVDIVEALTIPLPALAITLLLGLPEDDWRHLRRWAEGQIKAMLENDAAAIDKIHDEMTAYFDEQVEIRRKEPTGDVLTAMLESDVDGRKLSDEELRGMFLLLTIAGHETTTNALSSIIRYLAEHPNDRRRLSEDNSLMPKAVEEFLRFVAPVRAGARTTSRDVEIGGRVIPQDSRVVMMFASGSQDAKHFDQPDVCDFARQGVGTHLTFGTGAHRCVGEHLARLELRVVLEELLRRVPDFTVSGTPTPSLWPVNGYSKLRISF